MRSFWLDPYLWVHLAGVAVVPIALEGCLLGFAASNSLLPPWVELGLVGAIGALPILWMQWQRPFCIYSLMFLAVQPRHLSDEQRRILRRFKEPLGKGLSVLTAVLLFVVLWPLYQLAPIAWESSAIVPGGALGGLLLATVSFLVSNLFLQVPVSVAQVMLTKEQTIAATEPYPVNAVARDFTLFGVWINQQILPPLRATTIPATAAAGTGGTETGTIDSLGDRSKKNAKTRYPDPQPRSENAQPQAGSPPNPAAQTSAPRTKRNFVPVEVIDAEFRELDTEDEWDETIVSEEESLTEDPPASPEAQPAVAAVNPDPETQVAANLETDLETSLETNLETNREPLSEAIETSDLAAFQATAEEIAETAEATAEPISIETEIETKTGTEETEIETETEDELLEPIPEPIEEQPETRITSPTGADSLQISSMTLMETEDVSEEAAVDVSAVEVVTAEIVEDVSEEAAVPAETIESWLEDDWEDETPG
ncbi:low-complexity tail membrane protein [Leptolyngbya sp. GB1-A1]|uniref:low-complexity tail membrane protein n=1 Tax=Leptolyngbya sp. GB1-A1 TaxID=2933908 RepID=UPI003298AD06